MNALVMLQGFACGEGAGLQAVACAGCCAGPILGVLTAIGLGTAAGLALFGTIALLVGTVAVGLIMARRRRRTSRCQAVDAPASASVTVTITGSHLRR